MKRKPLAKEALYSTQQTQQQRREAKHTQPARIQYIPLACGGLLLRNLATGLVARVR